MTERCFSRKDLYLAFDTAGPTGSVAVGRGCDPLARVLLEQRAEHSARLVPAIDEALEEAGVALGELSGLIVGEGPGSFTGVRVAAASAKGMARALDLPLWAISSLAAAALARDDGPIRYVLFDARSDRVYGACYGIGSARVQTLVLPHAGNLRDVLSGEVPAGAVFVGDAATRHRPVIEAAGFSVSPDGGPLSLADGLLSYLGLDPRHEPVDDVSTWEPRYLRPSKAKPVWST